MLRKGTVSRTSKEAVQHLISLKDVHELRSVIVVSSIICSTWGWPVWVETYSATYVNKQLLRWRWNLDMLIVYTQQDANFKNRKMRCWVSPTLTWFNLSRLSLVGPWRMYYIKGRAIAQAVSRWLLTSATRSSSPGLVMWDFVVDKVALGQVFSEYFGFPCQSSFHQLLHNHPRLSSGVCTIGQKWP
jgi:hypothetical protein